MDRYGHVAEVCYTGTDGIETYNLSSLLGLHASFFNGLVRRGEAESKGHREGGFPGGDLITFLRQAWATTLYDPRFPGFAGGLVDSLGGEAPVEALWVGLQGILAAGLIEGGEEEVDSACAEAVALGVGVSGDSLPPETRRKVQESVKKWLGGK